MSLPCSFQCLASPFSIPFYRDRLIRGDHFRTTFRNPRLTHHVYTFWMRQAFRCWTILWPHHVYGLHYQKRILLWDAHFHTSSEQKAVCHFIGRFRKEFALFTVLFERSVVFTLVISVVNTTNFTGRIIFRTGADNGAFTVWIFPLYFPIRKYSNAGPSSFWFK